MKQGITIFARWLAMLALGLWLGGILFLGAVSAPAIFHFLRDQGQAPLAPQLFGVMLVRFAFVGFACAGLALVAWLIEGVAARPVGRALTLWRVQGLCLAVMLSLSLYLHLGVLPVLLRDQTAVIAESLKTGVALSAKGTEGKSQMRLRYDAQHENHKRLTSVVLFIGIAALASFAGRLSVANPQKS